MLDNHVKGNFWLNKALLGEIQRVVRWLFDQISSLRMGEALEVFNFRATKLMLVTL